MNRLGILVLLLIGCISCTEESAEDIVLKSMEYHGGIAAWEAVDELSYLKTTKLYKADGSLESETSIVYHHPLYRDLPASMRWLDDSQLKAFKLDSAGVIKANFDLTAKDSTRYRESLRTAPYTLCQPFKLMVDADLLVRFDDEVLEDGQGVYVIGLGYTESDGSEGTKWKYYFNNENYRLEAALVLHNGSYSYIRNDIYENKTGLSLNAKRTSYRTDSLRNVQYVRGEFLYEYLEEQ